MVVLSGTVHSQGWRCLWRRGPGWGGEGRSRGPVCLRAGKLVSSCRKSTELEGPLAHLDRAPDFTGPEGLRNLPKLTQQQTQGGCCRRQSTLLAGWVNWGSWSQCCDAIGFYPPPPFIVSCCGEVSPGVGVGVGEGWGIVKGGGKQAGLGEARPALSAVAALRQTMVRAP